MGIPLFNQTSKQNKPSHVPNFHKFVPTNVSTAAFMSSTAMINIHSSLIVHTPLVKESIIIIIISIYNAPFI